MPRIVKKPEERRREIVDAAHKIFQKQQYEKTTMQDVMDRLGIAKGTIYHYFNSKEELFEAVIEQTVREYIERMQILLDETDGDALERLRVLIAASNVADEQGQMLEHLHHPGNIGVHTRQLALTLTKLAPLYAGVIQQGCEEGVFQTEHPLECAEFVLAGIQFLSDIGFYPWKQEDLLRRAMAFPALIEAQLHAPKGAFNFLVEQI